MTCTWGVTYFGATIGCQSHAPSTSVLAVAGASMACAPVALAVEAHRINTRYAWNLS